MKHVMLGGESIEVPWECEECDYFHRYEHFIMLKNRSIVERNHICTYDGVIPIWTED